jgi:hypothetical protein
VIILAEKKQFNMASKFNISFFVCKTSVTFWLLAGVLGSVSINVSNKPGRKTQ